MKKFNKILIAGLVLLVIFATSITAFAFTGRIPVEIVSGLTGKTAEEVAEIKSTGKTYGQIAYDAGEDVWEEFRNEMLENKKAILKERVDDGTLTQEEADQFLANIEEMQDYCLENGGGFGMMRNKGNNNGFGMGNGFGNEAKGMGFGGGRCGRGSW